VRAAERLGYPVVTKPWNGNHGRGISVDLNTPEAVRAGFAAAQAHSASVIVETCLRGDDHRLLVVGGELVAATRRTPGGVTGDGMHTVAQLVRRRQPGPAPRHRPREGDDRLEIDEQAADMLARQGLQAGSVPAAGQWVALRSTANLSTGGTATDVTDVIHPDNREMAVRAVTAIGLDVGGVDFLTPDITESYAARPIGGASARSTRRRAFACTWRPARARRATSPVRSSTCCSRPAAAGARPGPHPDCRHHRHQRQDDHQPHAGAHRQDGRLHVPGLTSTDGVYIDGQRTVEGDMTGPVATRMVLADPKIDLAVLEIARGGLLRAGMGVPWINVGAVLNVKADHLGMKGIDTLEQLAEVKRILVEVARDCAVLNADDERVIRMSAHTDAQHLCYVTLDPQHAVVREHVRAGGRACALEAGVNGQMITLYDKGRHIPLLWTHLIPATLEGRAMHNVRTPCSPRPWASAWAFRWTPSARACAPSTAPSTRRPGA
jgi:cyanophycin synthetase